ncbi:MAG: class I SAM-dependent methyltransferase [Lachnospiraceae bacterium]|nr:class I SAM-dependent methyltransferase [Lachnospiraceae bacterium]
MYSGGEKMLSLNLYELRKAKGITQSHLAEIMMSLMPKESTYTGIDISRTMIEDGKSRFREKEFKTTFECRDGYEYGAKGKYDVVVCQAFLRELSDPKKMLKNMLVALKPGGLIICIEVNRELDNAGTENLLEDRV